MQNGKENGIIGIRGDTISNEIELGHPADIVFGHVALNQRQQRVLDDLPEYGSQTIVNKKEVSMLDLSALTAHTGDEFAMFTREGKRMIMRGDYQRVPIGTEEAEELRAAGYRWTGHTHPGIMETSLIASDGDRLVLQAFGQTKSALYNSVGKWDYVVPKGE